MRLKVDENLPKSLVAWFAALGHDAEHVDDEGLLGHPDPDIWNAAQREGRVLLTLDRDFGAIGRDAQQHHGVIVLRPVRQHPEAVEAVLAALFAKGGPPDCANRVVIAGPNRVRIVPSLSLIRDSDTSS
jgi:predicted nuclease of predicted toxin-antitoxin system